jgi:hypothetical protein
MICLPVIHNWYSRTNPRFSHRGRNQAFTGGWTVYTLVQEIEGSRERWDSHKQKTIARRTGWVWGSSAAERRRVESVAPGHEFGVGVGCTWSGLTTIGERGSWWSDSNIVTTVDQCVITATDNERRVGIECGPRPGSGFLTGANILIPIRRALSFRPASTSFDYLCSSSNENIITSTLP